MGASRPKPLLSPFRVADWLIQPDTCRMICRGKEKHLRPLLIDLLVLLCERKGQVVTKDEILDRIWGTPFISESSLTRSMAELRRYLGDDSKQPRFIETIAKRGYRLIADVQLPEAAAKQASNVSTKPMIAILPFENLSGDPDQDYFSDGITEEIITHLGSAQPETLRVIARTSVMMYKHNLKPLSEIAAELGVQYVLEGSVRREASRVRITAQLIQTVDQTHVWAHSYDDEIEQILVLQNKVAEAICAAIRLGVSHEIPASHIAVRPLSSRVHEEYLKGIYYWNKFTPEAAQLAIQHLSETIRLDTYFAPAHAALAQVLGMIGFWGYAPPAEVNVLARAEAERALELDESLAIAHGALGCCLALHAWEFEAARRELQKAVDLNPSEATIHLWYALYYAVMVEDSEKAIAESQIATRLDPWSPLTRLMVSSTSLMMGEYERARIQAQSIIQMLPQSLHAYRVLGLAYLGEGLLEHAVIAFENAVSIARESASVAMLAHACARSGQTQRAHALIDELLSRTRNEYVLPTSIASAYLGSGKSDLAFQWLEKAFQERCGAILFLKKDPTFQLLRSDQRFIDLLSRLGLRVGQS